MDDFTQVKLGKLPVRHDARTLHADTYFGAVSPPPPAVDWQGRVPHWKMYANDSIGDCTCATVGHFIEQWTTDATGAEIDVTDADVVHAYSAITGYNPADPSTDQGANELDVLNYWRKTGVAGHQIAAYVKLDVKNHDQIKQAVNLFGGVYIGINMPKSAQSQTGPGKTWVVTAGPNGVAGSWGGHAVHVGQYDGTKLSLVTWGAPQAMSWSFWDAYVEEAYAIVSKDFFNGDKDPQGFDIATLQADLAAIAANNPTPVPAPPVPPAPTPTPTPVPPAPTPTPEPPAPGPTPVVDITVVISDPVLLDHVIKAAARKGRTPEDWVVKHLDRYFGLYAQVGDFLDVDTEALDNL